MVLLGTANSADIPPFRSCIRLINKLYLYVFHLQWYLALLTRTPHAGLYCSTVLYLFSTSVLSSLLPSAAIRTDQPCTLGADIIFLYVMRILESALEAG